ncbi:hypothetical protein GF420_16300 [candidate division GN15 bacterium]|nr:hypothetical protein [candidate division GN15 bacterium]
MSLTVAGVLLVVLFTGCGGLEPVTFVADEEATMAQAERSAFKFCHIRDREICQSPDSALVFHLPRSLEMLSTDRSIADELIIANESLEAITIDEYFLTLIDDRQGSYPVRFSGPNGYDETRSFSPALTVGPKGRAKVTFVGELTGGAGGIAGLAIAYRKPGDSEFKRVLVSYRPRLLDSYRQESQS